MKQRIITVLMSCLFLCGCTAKDVPQLLEPAGETTDSAKVTIGEMYNVATYNSAVTSEWREIKMPEDGIVKGANVQIGDSVNKGDKLLTLDKEAEGSQTSDIDKKIKELEKEHAYLNEIDEYDLEILRYELEQINDMENNVYTKQKKEKEIEEKRAEIEKQKVEQQKEIAELQLTKMEGTSAGEDIEATHKGKVVYLNAGNNGSVIAAGTVVAILALDDSKILFGDYIDRETVRQAHRIYARIGEKEYKVTNVPYEQFELNQRLFFKLPLYSTFYIEEAPEITQGMFASIVVISDYVENALQIPENALLSDEEGYYVYKKNGEKFDRQNVTVGHMTETAVEITSGLKEGEEVYVKP